MNCWVTNPHLEVSCELDYIMNVKHEWYIYLQLTDKMWFIILTTIHAQELICFDSNTQKNNEKAVVSFKFYHLSAIALKNPTNIFYCYTDVYMYFLSLLCAKMTLHCQGNIDDEKDDIIKLRQLASFVA